MVLVDSWRESCRLLMPKQAKMLLLVTANCLRDLFYSRFALGIIIPLAIGISFSMVYADFPGLLFARIGVSLIVNALIFLLLLLLRPSVMIKNRYYFMNYQWHIAYVVVSHALISGVHVFRPPSLPGWLWLVWAPLSCFWLLFFIDSHATLDSFVRSFIRALLMFVYNVPFCLVATSLWYLLFAGLSQWPILFMGHHSAFVKDFWQFLSGSIFGVALFPLWYVVITNVYVKQLHEQFGLYFGNPLS